MRYTILTSVLGLAAAANVADARIVPLTDSDKVIISARKADDVRLVRDNTAVNPAVGCAVVQTNKDVPVSVITAAKVGLVVIDFGGFGALVTRTGDVSFPDAKGKLDFGKDDGAVRSGLRKIANTTLAFCFGDRK